MSSPIPSNVSGDTMRFVRVADDFAATPMRYYVPMHPADLVCWTPARVLRALANGLLTAPRLFMPVREPAVARIRVRKDPSV